MSGAELDAIRTFRRGTSSERGTLTNSTSTPVSAVNFSLIQLVQWLLVGSLPPVLPRSNTSTVILPESGAASGPPSSAAELSPSAALLEVAVSLLAEDVSVPELEQPAADTTSIAAASRALIILLDFFIFD